MKFAETFKNDLFDVIWDTSKTKHQFSDFFQKKKNWFHGFRSDTKCWIFFPKTSSLKKPKTVVKSGELLLMRTQEFFEEIVVLKAHNTLSDIYFQ